MDKIKETQTQNYSGPGTPTNDQQYNAYTKCLSPASSRHEAEFEFLLFSPDLCQPKFMVLVGGLEEIHRENRLTIMLPKSVRRWAASVMMARLWAR